MKRELYLNEDFCAATEEGRLVEYLPVREEDGSGKILRGRVDRMMPGLEAAFVDIGRRKDGFLPLRENSQSFTGNRLRSGDRILVQIRKEENGGKGAFLTRDLSIPGSYLILMPMNRHIGVSARVKENVDREKLLRIGQEMAAGRFGLVMREASLQTEPETLHAELEELLTQWGRIQEGDLSAGSLAEELIRDYTPRGIDAVHRDAPLTADLERQRKESENRQVRLPHGGNIVIDRCEAMTVIDVNSASDTGEGSRRETTLRTNLEACREIMIQTRLRNLSGILIIDFIDMDAAEDQERVRQELESAFREDRVKTVIHGYTRLGLMEMTRRRMRSAWQDRQCM